MRARVWGGRRSVKRPAEGGENGRPGGETGSPGAKGERHGVPHVMLRIGGVVELDPLAEDYIANLYHVTDAILNKKD